MSDQPSMRDQDDENYLERRTSLRRSNDLQWRPTHAFFVKAAAGVAGVVFLVGFLMQILGWRFTGSGADIKANTEDISQLQSVAATTTATTSANTQAIASVVATVGNQARDIADLKATLASLMFLQCAMYSKTFVDAPPYMGCVKGKGSP